MNRHPHPASFSLDPASRQVRLALAEKRLAFDEVLVRYWEQPKAFTALNPSGLTPVLVERTGDAQVVVCEVRAHSRTPRAPEPEPDLLGARAADRPRPGG